MKKLILFISIIFSSLSLFAQDTKDIVTKTYKVEGNCGSCKKRIEAAAFNKGVKRVEWNKETHILTLIYKPSKTSDTTILQNIAKAGHSNELFTAAEKDYDKLPDCCKYKTHVCND